jgi:hypothetical protein
MNNKIAYTDKMLATIFRMKEATVTMALQTFEQFGMVEIVDGVITIPNWGKHQNLDQLETKKQYMRNYMAEYREKQKALTAGKPNCKTNSKTNVSQADKEEDKEKEIEEDIKEIYKEKADCQQIVDLFNSICKTLPSVRSLSEARKKAIKARLNTYTVEDFKQCFENAEASSFLKGSNNRNWVATFDWLIKDTNMAKVLDGNYTDKQQGRAKSYDVDSFFEASVVKTWEEKEAPKTAAEDEALQERLIALRERLSV